MGNKFFPQGSPDWAVRRWMAVSVMLFCFVMIPLGAFLVVSEARADTLMTNSFTVLGGLVAVYIGAAVVDDHFKRQTAANLPPGERIEERITTVTKTAADPSATPAPATADPAPDDLPTSPPRTGG